MKKNLFLLGIAVAALTSCTTNEVVDMSDNTQNNAIGFSTWVGKTTRATATDNTRTELQKKGKGFYVHGQYQDKDDNTITAFNGEEQSHVTWIGDESTGSWGYSPINYWQKNTTYKFAAFAPTLPKGTHSFDYTSNVLTITDFVADGQTDLIVAATPETGEAANSHINIGANPTPVNLTFRHALSKVNFSFKNGWRNNVTLKITNIKLSGLVSKGTLKTPNNLASNRVQNANWEQTATSNEGGPSTIGLQADGSYSDEGTGDNGLNIYGTTYEFENFFIPQDLTTRNIELTFTVTVTNDKNTGPDLDGSGNNTTTLTAQLPTNDVKTWVPGYAYKYIIEISGSTFGLNPITFDVLSVEDWDKTTKDTDWTITTNAQK